MKKITLLVGTLVYLFVSAFSTSAQWIKTSANCVSAVECLASNGSTIFAGTLGNGIYRSTNNGLTWAAANTGLSTGFPIYSIAVSGSNIFAASFGSGVYLSTDNGTHWVRVDSGLTGRFIESIAMNGTYIYAATGDQGVFRSTNNGGKWIPIDTGLTSTYLLSLAESGTNLYGASYYGGVYLSTDSGKFWGSTSLSGSIINSFAVSGANVFAASQTGGMFFTRDTGKSWAIIDSGLTNTAVYGVAAKGTEVLAGTNGNGVFASQNNGGEWDLFDSTGLTNKFITSLTIDVDTIFAGTSNGQVWKRALSDVAACTPYIGNNDTIFCQGGSATLSVSGGGNGYAWNTGSTTQSITVTSTGNYSCVVSTNCGFIKTNTVTVTVNPAPYAAITADGPLAFCKGDSVDLTASIANSYLWSTTSTLNTIKLKISKSVTVTLTGANGCKSTAHVNVREIVSAITSAPKSVTVIANCFTNFTIKDTAANATYQWQVNTGSGFSNLSNAGIYSGVNTDSLVISNADLAMNSYSYLCIITNLGCNDTSAAATLTVKAAKATSRSVSLCAGDSLTVLTHTYDISGTYLDTLRSMNGCDSIIYTTHVAIDSIIKNTQSVSICAGANLVVGSHIYSDTTKSGTYIDSLFNGHGCDSIVTTKLTVRPAIMITQKDTLCAGDSLTVLTHTYTVSGTYIDTLQSLNGCDSIIYTTHLVLDSIIKHSQTITICAGNSFTVGTHTYNATGTYIDSLQNGRGCDSIVTTHLAIDSLIKTTQTITLCKGLSLVVGNHTYSDTTKSGTYIDSLNNHRGCDSIVTTKLTVRPAIVDSQTVVLCAGQSITIGINTHDTTGTYSDTLTTGQGCDSIVTTHLTIRNVITGSQTDTLCAGDSLTVGIHTYHSSGIYTDTLTSGNGCDSILTTHLTISNLITGSQTVSLCAGNSLTVNHHTYNTSGTYIDTLISATGCDSILTTNLVIDTLINTSQTVTLCAGDSLVVGSHIHNATGTYIDSLAAGVGCDSIVTTQLTINADVNIATSVSGDTIKASASGANYQWINCNGNTIITGKTGQSFTPTADGSYAVIVTVGRCSDISACVPITNVGIVDNTLNYSITVYPNPATNQLTIHTSSPLINKAVTVSVMNVLGKTVQEEKLKWSSDISININNLPAGMYFLQLKSEGGSVVNRFVKE